MERQTTEFSAEAQVAAADPSISRCDPAARLVSFRQSLLQSILVSLIGHQKDVASWGESVTQLSM
jgi:hypothetical protein